MIENDGRYPDGAEVMARFPGPDSAQEDRERWPWMSATVEQQCGPDEWLLTVEDRSAAHLEDGSPAPEGTPEEDLWHPGCLSRLLRDPAAAKSGR